MPDNDQPELPGSGKERLSPIPDPHDPGSVQHRETAVAGEEFSVEKQIDLTQKSYSQGELIRRRFFHHRGAMISLGFLLFITLMAVSSIGYGFIPGWWPKDYTVTSTVTDGGRPSLSLFPPVWGEQPFGQDDVGKDYFALTMRGTQRSLTIAFTVGILTTLLGTVIGAIAGYFRGWVEAILMRITDLFIVIPLLVLAAVLGQSSGGGIWPLAIMLSLVSWTGLARLVRGEVLSLREREFVTAAEAIGTSPWRIIFKHILPNTMGTIIVSATLTIATVILLESALSFLGFGIPPDTPDWGIDLARGQDYLRRAWWLITFPGAMVTLVTFAFSMLGESLSEILNPRLSEV